VRSTEPAYSTDARTAYVTTQFAGSGTYSYLYAIDISSGTTAVHGSVSPPHTSPALAVSPNPFRSMTVVALDVARSGPARLSVYDASGRLVRRLLDRSLDAGRLQVRWGGRDDGGARVAPGVYFMQLEGPGGRRTAKLMRLD
jgi:hypothetical protein